MRPLAARAVGRRAFLGLAALWLLPGRALAVPSASEQTLAALEQARTGYDQALSRLATMGALLEAQDFRYRKAAGELAAADSRAYELAAALERREEELARAKASLEAQLAKGYREGDPSAVEAVASGDLSAAGGAWRRRVSEIELLAEEVAEASRELEALALSRESLAAQSATALSALRANTEALQDELESLGPLVSELTERAQREAAASKEALYLACLQAQESYEQAARDAEAIVAAQERGGWWEGASHLPEVLDYAISYLGVAYLWGGSDPSEGLDCSGLTSLCYAQAGHPLPRTSYEQHSLVESLGHMVYDIDLLAPGDLIFPQVGHVALYAGGGNIVHAPAPGRVVTYEQAYGFIGGGSPLP